MSMSMREDSFKDKSLPDQVLDRAATAHRTEIGEDTIPEFHCSVDWPESTSPFWKLRTDEDRQALVAKIKAGYKSRGELEREWTDLCTKSRLFLVLSWVLNKTMVIQNRILTFMGRRWAKPEFVARVDIPEANQMSRERPVSPVIELVYKQRLAGVERQIKEFEAKLPEDLKKVLRDIRNNKDEE